VLTDPERLIDEPTGGAGQGQIPVRCNERGESLEHARFEPDRRWARSSYHV
jgi:hypothetical protein